LFITSTVVASRLRPSAWHHQNKTVQHPFTIV